MKHPPPGRPVRAARRPGAFTLVELLVVMGIIVLLVGLAVPAVNALRRSGDVTTAAYDVSETLGRARAYAMANSTYVWVGIFEEDGSRPSTTPATAGNGRLVLSTIYSRDGTSLFDPAAAGGTPRDATLTGQYGGLVKIEDAHLYAFANGTGNPQDGVFAGRPPAGGNNDTTCRISDTLPANGQYSFYYPAGVTASSKAQYTFAKLIQFSPRGEVRINCAQDLKPVIEIGLVHSRGSAPDLNGKNIVAVQMTGIASNVKIYRP